MVIYLSFIDYSIICRIFFYFYDEVILWWCLLFSRLNIFLSNEHLSTCKLYTLFSFHDIEAVMYYGYLGRCSFHVEWWLILYLVKVIIFTAYIAIKFIHQYIFICEVHLLFYIYKINLGYHKMTLSASNPLRQLMTLLSIEMAINIFSSRLISLLLIHI